MPAPYLVRSLPVPAIITLALFALFAFSGPASFAQQATCADFEPEVVVNSGCTVGEPFELRIRSITNLQPAPNIQCAWTLPSGPEDRCDFLHTVNDRGEFQYTLTVTLPDGTVCPEITRSIELDYLAPFFEIEPNPACEPGDVVTFTATPEGLANYNWTSGADNVNTTDPDWSKAFPSPGNYPVTLTARNDIGCEVPVTRTVRVLAPPLQEPPVEATVSVCVNPGETAGPVDYLPVFELPSGEEIDSATIDWSFPGGTPASSTDLEPTIEYAEGVYNYSITYETSNGCEYEYNGTVEVIVVEMPDLEVITPDDPVCKGDTIDLATNPPAASLPGEFNWSEGTQIITGEGGDFETTLEYVDRGCTTTVTGQYSVTDFGVDFKELEWIDRYICDLATETPSDFEILSDRDDLEYSWEFYQHQGEGVDSILMTPDFPTPYSDDKDFSYAFTEDNTEYTVVLNVRDPATGQVCPVEKVQWIVIANPAPQMTMDPPTICLWGQVEIEGGAVNPEQHDLNIQHHLTWKGVDGPIAGESGNIILDTTTGFISKRPVGPDGGPFEKLGRYEISYEISNNKIAGENRCPTQIVVGFVDVVGVDPTYEVVSTNGCPPLDVSILETDIEVYPAGTEVEYSEWQLEGGLMGQIEPPGWERTPLEEEEDWSRDAPDPKDIAITINGPGEYNFALRLEALGTGCDTLVRSIAGENVRAGMFPFIDQESGTEGCPGDSVMLIASNQAEEMAAYEWYSPDHPDLVFVPDSSGNSDTTYFVLPADDGIDSGPDEDLFEIFVRATRVDANGDPVGDCNASTEDVGNPHIVERLGVDFDFYVADGEYVKSCAPAQFTFVALYEGATADTRYGWSMPGSEEEEAELNILQEEQIVTYNGNGTYDVSLTVQDSFGCVITRTKEDFVEVDAPVPEIYLVNESWCGIGPVLFENKTPYLERVIIDYDMGNVLQLPEDPTALVVEPGIIEYDIPYDAASANLGVEDTIQIRVQSIKDVNNQCLITKFMTLRVLPEGNFDFELPPSPYCAPTTFTPIVEGEDYPVNWTMATTLGQVESSQREPVFSVPAPPDPTLGGPFEVLNNGLIGVPVTAYVETPDGCPGQITRIAPVGVKPLAAFRHRLSPDCISGLVVFQDDGSQADPEGLAPMGISGFFQSEWDFGNGGFEDGLGPFEFQYDESGSYNVRLIVENEQGCRDTASERVTVDFYGEGASFTSTPEAAPNVIFFPPEPRVTFSDSATGVISWKWNFGDGTPETVLPPPVEHVYPARAGEYDVEVERTFENSCLDTLQLRLMVKSNVTSSPNVFTPNGDGVNDFWKIPQGGSESYSLRVYDRWGQLIKTIPASEAEIGWDGNFNGEPVPEGVYFYQLELDGISRSGSITVVR